MDTLATVSIVAILLFVFASIVTSGINKSKKIKRLYQINKDNSDRNILLASELKDIASLNKYCIERWEKSVHQNQALHLENNNLIELLKQPK